MPLVYPTRAYRRLGQVSGDATYCTLDEIVQSGAPGAVPGGVLIGTPLPGVHLSVVGPDLLPVPVGQPGELLVGGVGVALGYHCHHLEAGTKFLRSAAHDCERKAGSGVHIPGLQPGRRVFRTGDRVVQPMAGGPFFWLGKLDGEVWCCYLGTGRVSCSDLNSAVVPFCHARGRESRDGDNLERNMGRPCRAAVLIFDGCTKGTIRATGSSIFAARFSTRFFCQVKVRGARVSLEEVEILACRATGLPAGAFSAVYHPGRMATNKIPSDGSKHDKVAAAIATNDPDRGRLLGFFVLKGAPDTTDGFAEMKRQMTTEMTAAQLPAVLLPVVGGFPLTSTGKVRHRCVGLLFRDAAYHACLRRGFIGHRCLILVG